VIISVVYQLTLSSTAYLNFIRDNPVVVAFDFRSNHLHFVVLQYAHPFIRGTQYVETPAERVLRIRLKSFPVGRNASPVSPGLYGLRARQGNRSTSCDLYNIVNRYSQQDPCKNRQLFFVLTLQPVLIIGVGAEIDIYIKKNSFLFLLFINLES